MNNSEVFMTTFILSNAITYGFLMKNMWATYWVLPSLFVSYITYVISRYIEEKIKRSKEVRNNEICQM